MASLQDLSRLGRDLRRTVLVDDTPLAFLRQPDNGIPIFNFRHAPARPFPASQHAENVPLVQVLQLPFMAHCTLFEAHEL